MRTQLPCIRQLVAPIFALLATTFGIACSGEPDRDVTVHTYAIGTRLQPSRAPALAFDGTSMLAVWPEVVGGNTELFARAFSQAGVAQTPKTRITPNNGFSKHNVDVAFGNGFFLVVFEQPENGSTTTKGIRLQLGGGAVLISQSLFAIDSAASFPRVAFASQRGKFFMVTLGAGVVNGRYIRTDGMVEAVNLIADRQRTLQDPDVAYSAGAVGSDTLLVSWAEVRSGEQAMVATIPNGSTTAHPPLDVMTGDATSLTFNAAASGGGRFGLGIVDDNGPNASGISIASLAVGCRTDVPSTCDVKRSLAQVFKPDINMATHVSASVAPVGTGFIVITTYGVAPEPQYLTSLFFNEALALTRTQRLFSAPDGSSLKSVWVSNTSMTGLANTKSVLAYQLLKADGTLSLRGLTTTPPQSFESAFSVSP